jgi:hypothetical protein
VVAGLAAGSVALFGFGVDSAIEGLASVIVIWRFTGARTLSAQAERRAHQLVAVSFFASLVTMPLLGRAKRRIGERIGSVATSGELDPVAGLVIAVVAAREGRAAWRGESCCDIC